MGNFNFIFIGTFKGLYPSTTPFGKKSLVKVVGLMIQKRNFLSTLKRDCENYLYVDYPLKA